MRGAGRVCVGIIPCWVGLFCGVLGLWLACSRMLLLLICFVSDVIGDGDGDLLILLMMCCAGGGVARAAGTALCCVCNFLSRNLGPE